VSALDLAHPLAFAPRGRLGARTDAPLIVSMPPREIVQVMVRRGQGIPFAAAMRDGFGIEPPGPGHATTGEAVTAIWVQPGQWFLVAPRGAEGGLAARAQAALGALATVTDQSHGRTTITLSGTMAREALSHGCRLDLHPRAFGPGRAANTVIAQIGCLLHQADAAPSFELTVFSTLAEPFLHWLLDAAAPFGVEVA